MKRQTMLLTDEELRRLYQDEGYSAAQIGQMVGRSASFVLVHLRRVGIPVRTKSEAGKLGSQSRQPATKAELRRELVCRKCGATWQYTEGWIQTQCPYCGAIKDARVRHVEAKQYDTEGKRKASLQDWYTDRENRRQRNVKSRALIRKRVFFRISGTIEPKCVRCGCDDVRMLEVNHKDGGGGREVRSRKTPGDFYRDIAIGKRTVEDLEILCRPCNAIHFLEMKYGPLPMKVVWSGPKTPSSTRGTA